jgi:hypothetical protein
MGFHSPYRSYRVCYQRAAEKLCRSSAIRRRRGESEVSFQATRLRVALPNGKETAVELPAGDEPVIKGVCIDPASFVNASCADKFTWYLLLVRAAPASLDAEQLPILRQELEARLKEVDDTERALKDRGGSSQ